MSGAVSPPPSSLSSAKVPSSSSLQSYLDLAVSLSHRAGALILTAFYSHKAISIKSNPLDIVTETDKSAEVLIIDGIRQVHPSHQFIAEESHTTPGSYSLTSHPTWIIDPVDGTNNFVHSLPFVCVSIALVIDREIVVGVVHAPVLGETFTAVKGQGAFLTNHAVYHNNNNTATSTSTLPLLSPITHRLSTSSIQSLSRAAVITELGYDRSIVGIGRQLERLRLLCTQHSLQSLRSYGSCALNMAYVSAGRAEAYYEGWDSQVGPKPWDSAAGALLVTEAGGVVTDTNGGPFDFTVGRVLACNHPTIAQIIVDVCTQVELTSQQQR